MFVSTSTYQKSSLFFLKGYQEESKNPSKNLLDAYPFGFNGQEKDEELKGKGNDYDFGARMYDSRIGRWFTPDAYASKYPNTSPYSFSLNNPIYLIDPSGDTVTVHITVEKVGTTSINLFSSDEVKTEVDAKTKKVIKQGVKQQTKVENVYKVTLKNDAGSTATFYYTRIAHRGDKDNTDAEPNDVTFDPSKDGEVFIGKIRSRWKGTDNVLELTPLSGKRDDGYDSYKGTADGRKLENRKYVQLHVKGASDGCLLAVGYDQFESVETGITIDKTDTGSNSTDAQSNFMQKLKDMMDEDKDINCTQEIRIKVDQLKTDDPK